MSHHHFTFSLQEVNLEVSSEVLYAPSDLMQCSNSLVKRINFTI